MNITEAKALFFAQYLGQEIVCPEFETSENFSLDGITIVDLNINEGKLITIPKNSAIITGDFSEGTSGYNQTGVSELDCSHLLLRSVDQLTDGEAIILGFLSSSHINKCINAYGLDRFYDELIGIDRHLTLICLGVLVKFLYINETNEIITLQPADIIANGWAKLTTT